MKKKIFMLFLACFLLLGINSNAQAARRLICVTGIKGTTMTYYSAKVQQEWPVKYGKKKKVKLTKKAKYYCYKNNNYDADTKVPRVSKKRFVKKVKTVKKYNKEGFYVFATFKKKKCVKLVEPYWP